MNVNSEVDDIIWVLRVEVTPGSVCPYTFSGAYVNAVMCSVSASYAESVVCQHFEAMGFVVVNTIHIQDYRRIESKFRQRVELKQLVQRAKRTHEPQIGVFHAW